MVEVLIPVLGIISRKLDLIILRVLEMLSRVSTVTLEQIRSVGRAILCAKGPGFEPQFGSISFLTL